MRFRFPLFFLLPSVMVYCQSNHWREISLLKSTCEDVKKILKVDKCTLPISEYTLPDFRVMVEFQTETCDRAPQAWRVPIATVTALTISPRNEMRPSELGLDLSKYKKREGGDIIGVDHYDSDDEGVTVDVYRGFVQNLFLYPRKSEAVLRCNPLK